MFVDRGTHSIALRQEVMFVDRGAGDREIYVMNADGSEQKNLSRNPSEDYEPSWSSDSSKIAFTSKRDGFYTIYVIDAVGGEATRITERGTEPVWSPLGNKPVFANYGGQGETLSIELYSINADASDLKMITTPPTGAETPRWSPDASKIVFERWTNRIFGGGKNLFVIDADGKNQRRLTAASSKDGHPSWSPDGSKIVFHSNRDGNFELYVMDVQ